MIVICKNGEIDDDWWTLVIRRNKQSIVNKVDNFLKIVKVDEVVKIIKLLKIVKIVYVE